MSNEHAQKERLAQALSSLSGSLLQLAALCHAISTESQARPADLRVIRQMHTELRDRAVVLLKLYAGADEVLADFVERRLFQIGLTEVLNEAGIQLG